MTAGGRGARVVGATLAVLGGLATVLGFGPVRPAEADPIGDCTSITGVVVVVDFSAWAGPTDMGCDAKTTNGYDALYAAGFITAGTQEFGPAFICRIGLAADGTSSYEPTPAAQSCVNTPPASASWAYWHADAGQDSWTYSLQGATSYSPPPGSIDAWVFGSGTTQQPSFTPDQVRSAASSGGSGSISAAPAAPPTTVAATPTTAASTPPTTDATKPASKTTSPTTRAPAPAATSTTDRRAHSPAPTVTTEPSTTAVKGATSLPTSTVAGAGTGQGRGSGASATPTTSGSAAGFHIVATPAASVRPSRSSSGVPAGFIAGVVVVVVVGAGAVVLARRRRQAA